MQIIFWATLRVLGITYLCIDGNMVKLGHIKIVDDSKNGSFKAEQISYKLELT